MKNCPGVQGAGVVVSSVRYGWSMTDSGLKSKLMTQATAINFAPFSCQYVKAGLLWSPACGCKSDSHHYENTVSLENQDEENMSDDSSDNNYD